MIQEDFEQHVVKLQGALLGFAKSLTHNDDEAKDLWQETALKALVNKEMYRDSGNIKSWLCTIMFNLFLNCRRLSSRQQAMIADFQLDAADDGGGNQCRMCHIGHRYSADHESVAGQVPHALLPLSARIPLRRDSPTPEYAGGYGEGPDIPHQEPVESLQKADFVTGRSRAFARKARRYFLSSRPYAPVKKIDQHLFAEIRAFFVYLNQEVNTSHVVRYMPVPLPEPPMPPAAPLPAPLLLLRSSLLILRRVFFTEFFIWPNE